MVGHDQDVKVQHRADSPHLLPRPLGQPHLGPDDLAVQLVLEAVAHVEVQPRVVSDDPVDEGSSRTTLLAAAAAQVLADAPLHPARLVDGPGQEELVGAVDLPQEHAARGAHEALLVEVEAEVGDAEEVVRVEQGGADVGEGEGREVTAGGLEEGCLCFCRVKSIFFLEHGVRVMVSTRGASLTHVPASQHDTLIPWNWSLYTIKSPRDGKHQMVGVIIKLVNHGHQSHA